MKIGVVIITYNNEKHIEATIGSLRNQSLKDWICVLVDNGSTDSTFEIAERLTANDEQFKIFKKSNEGPGPGRNLAFSKLPETLDYIHFLDGDDMISENYLSRMSSYMELHPEVGMVACQFDEIDNDGNYIGKGHRSRFAPSIWGLPHDIPPAVFPTPFVSFFSETGQGPFGLYRYSVYAQTGGYELKSHEDTDMFCKMALLAEVHYLPEFLYLKRVTTNNLAHDKKYRATHNFFREKWDAYRSDDPQINALIDKSLKYYYNKHKPFRDFKVGVKAFKIFVKKQDLHSLKWSLKCFRAGASDILFRKSYRKVIRKRNQVG